MARSQQDVDWQSTMKTVLERSRHMFNNPFMSDIMFSCEGSDKKFFAHKYVLATSSAVFYAMFYGELAEKNSVVHLSDTSEEILEAFLRFLYTDECRLTGDNAMFLLYLAKKYTVPPLAEKCTEFLEAILGVANVFPLLSQAIHFDERGLANKCWNLIDLQTRDVIASAAFIDIDKVTLDDLLKREELKVEEVDLFKAVLKWSEAECLRKGRKVNAKNIRATMGNAIYQIRFTSMTIHEFGQDVCQSGILTAEEKLFFFEKLSGMERASEVWNFSGRGAKKEILLRYSRFDNYALSISRNMETCEETLAISFSKPVKIYGVCLPAKNGQKCEVKLEVWSQKIEKKFHTQADRHDVMLPSPVRVQANYIVHLKVTITGRCCFSDELFPKTTRQINDITVKVFDTQQRGCIAVGKERLLIHQIIFCKI